MLTLIETNHISMNNDIVASVISGIAGGVVIALAFGITYVVVAGIIGGGANLVASKSIRNNQRGNN